MTFFRTGHGYCQKLRNVFPYASFLSADKELYKPGATLFTAGLLTMSVKDPHVNTPSASEIGCCLAATAV